MKLEVIGYIYLSQTLVHRWVYTKRVEYVCGFDFKHLEGMGGCYFSVPSSDMMTV